MNEDRKEELKEKFEDFKETAGEKLSDFVYDAKQLGNVVTVRAKEW